MNCSVDADADIAGRGVRYAVYIQALLCMVPPLVLILAGPDLDEAYASVGRKVYSQGRITVTTLIATNGALLIASYVKVSKGTLSLYHATIVLSLSWIVFLGALSSAVTLFFVHPLFQESVFKLWLRILLSPILPTSRLSLEQTARLTARRFRTRDAPAVSATVVHSEFHLICLCIHLLGIGILGVIVFKTGGNFAPAAGCNPVVLWTFNKRFPLTGPRFHDFWHGVYVVAVIPGISLIISAVVVVLIFALPYWLLYCLMWWTIPSIRQFARALRFGCVLPFLVIIPLLIVGTEKTISANIAAKAVTPGENAWGFGQILAMVVLAGTTFETCRAVSVIFLSPRPAKFPQLPARVAASAEGHQDHKDHALQRAGTQYHQWNHQAGLARGADDVIDITYSNLDRMLVVPATTGQVVIENATPHEIFGVIVPNGMRKEWDSDLDYEGVLKRYDPDTALRYAATKSRHAAVRPRDYVVVQHVLRDNQEITITYTSATEPMTDIQAKQKGLVRGTLEFEGWRIQQEGPDVRLTCVSLVALEDTLPLATARDIVRHSLSYPGKVRWTHRHYGFAPVWESNDNVVSLESEHMDTDSGTYTATLRSEGGGDINVICDTRDRRLYEPGAHAFWKVIKGSKEHLQVHKGGVDAPPWTPTGGSKTFLENNDDDGKVKLNFRFDAAGNELVVELTVIRSVKVSVSAEPNPA